ncbi:hypothetical protein J4402_04185 [Candidatus Pacearchaeota archaeon]|nr:hypothetical protein [Candidatus Pacearchaeota archaeon]
MAEILVRIPKDWEIEIEESGNLSLLIKLLLRRELQERARLRSIVSKSQLTEEDVKELSDKIDKALSKRFLQSIKE